MNFLKMNFQIHTKYLICEIFLNCAFQIPKLLSLCVFEIQLQNTSLYFKYRPALATCYVTFCFRLIDKKSNEKLGIVKKMFR